MIELLTASTPNGHKASITLEELGLDYSVTAIDLGKLDQKEPGFLAVNPNGRIPAIIDRDNDIQVITLPTQRKTGKVCARAQIWPYLSLIKTGLTRSGAHDAMLTSARIIELSAC